MPFYLINGDMKSLDARARFIYFFGAGDSLLSVMLAVNKEANESSNFGDI
jgi:hypothetical protein